MTRAVETRGAAATESKMQLFKIKVSAEEVNQLFLLSLVFNVTQSVTQHPVIRMAELSTFSGVTSTPFSSKGHEPRSHFRAAVGNRAFLFPAVPATCQLRAERQSCTYLVTLMSPIKVEF
jgi:hypothetical protein